MGVSTDGIVFYGWPLGDEGELGPFVVGRDELPWLELDDDGEPLDIVGDAEKAIKVRHPDSDAGLGQHCSNKATMYFLGCRIQKAWRGRPVVLDTTVEGWWPGELRDAAEALGLDPATLGQPAWHLVSWGDGF